MINNLIIKHIINSWTSACSRPIDPAHYRDGYPFRSHFLDRDGLAYHYIDEGAGEPVVMVHGNPTWSFYFRRLITALRPQRRVIVPDHIGCGLSARTGPDRYDFTLASRVADLGALLDHLGLTGKLTFVVHDWGGMIAMAWAAAHPERIARLVITNTAAFAKPAGKPLPLALRLGRNAGALSAFLIQQLNLFAIGAAFTATAGRLAPTARRGLLAPYNCPANRLALLRFVQDIPLGPADPSFHIVAQTDRNLGRLAGVPMLILWGLRDFVFDSDYLNQWQARFPHAEVHRFANAGHYLFEDRPEATVRIIKDFLNRNPAG